MNTNRVNAGNMLDVRITIAVLWIAGMLSSLNGDTYRLHDPVMLRASGYAPRFLYSPEPSELWRYDHGRRVAMNADGGRYPMVECLRTWL